LQKRSTEFYYVYVYHFSKHQYSSLPVAIAKINIKIFWGWLLKKRPEQLGEKKRNIVC
jgi:hypothetical protein